MKKIFSLLLLTLIANLAHSALLDEIQVYTYEINDPNDWAVEMHVNSTIKGITSSSYKGEVVNHHGLRLTPEISYGLTKTLEFGIYVPMVRSSDANWTMAGGKLRLKWLPIQVNENEGFFAGVNLELSQLKKQFSQSAKSLEMRNILGWKNNEWLFALNPILGWDLSPGFKSKSPDLTIATKISRSLSESVALGVEYYNGRGPLNQILPNKEQDKMMFAVLDYEGHPLNFNFGIGKGLNKSTDAWTVKGIIDLPF